MSRNNRFLRFVMFSLNEHVAPILLLFLKKRTYLFIPPDIILSPDSKISKTQRAPATFDSLKGLTKENLESEQRTLIKGRLMQILKSANVFVFI